MSYRDVLKRLSSIQGRLALLVWSLSAASIAIYVAFDIANERRATMRFAEQEIVSLAKVMASNVGVGLGARDKDAMRETLEAAFLMEGVVYAAVRDEAGRPVVVLGDSTRVAVDARLVDQTQLQRADNGLLVVSPVRNPHDEIVGSVALYRSLTDVWAHTRQLVTLSLGLLLVILVLGLAAAIVLAKQISRPIMALARAAERISAGEELEQLPAGEGILEVEVLTGTFREMLEKLERNRQLVEDQKRTLEVKVAERTEELRQMNLELAFQNEKVLEANRLKTRFLANVGHELRTPLNGILAVSEMLKEGVTGPLEPEQQEQVEIIHRSGTALLALINDTLDLSLIESGQMEFKPRSVRLIAFLQEEAERLRVLAESKGLQFDVVAQDGDEDEVEIDPDRVRQVLANLIINAIKFTDSGSVRVILERVQGGRTFRATIQDTGIGIPREDQATIFQEFWQLDATASRRHGGTGLGLAITKRVINLLGGEIWVDSEQGMGSTFSFIIPLTRQGGEDRSGRSGARMLAPSPPVAGRVLIVDGDQVESEYLARRFRRRGAQVVLASSSEEGLGILRNSVFHALVVSFTLPRMNAFQLLEAIHAGECETPANIAVSTPRDLLTDERKRLESWKAGIFRKEQKGLDALVESVCERLPLSDSGEATLNVA
ncbi:MAG: HAMP domain-containing protein [Candidatus Eisenbacteria bacterium]|nr:HAMP domain-containing protein [Candidatus Eisenbacteria bacterium]